MAKASAKRPIVPMSLWMGVSCGIAIGLIVMMLPVALLESIVEQTALASVLSAAAPPLGQTARGLLAAIAGLVMAISCFTLLRALEGLPPIRIGKRRTRRDPAEAIFDAAQPDELPAPALIEEPRRGPIMAARDLGAPFHSITAETVTVAALPDMTAEPSWETEPPLVLEPEMAEALPELAPPQPEFQEPEFQESGLSESEPLEPESAAEPALEPEDALDEPAVADDVVAIAESAPLPVSPARAEIEGSIPALVHRLETGFERRLAGREAEQSEPGQSEPGFVDPQPDIDVALRDALGTLQRMSARSR